jgi:ribonuclease HI
MQFKLTNTNNTFYAVRKGFNPGVYDSWEECKKQVHKYSGAEYKKFKNKNDAENFIKGIELNNDLSDINDINYYKAYTDGSCDRENKIFSYGIVILNNDDFVITRIYEGFKDTEYAEHANISGECFGVIHALDYCLHNNITNLIIYHDYLGLAQWANGLWQTNTSISKFYVDKINFYRQYINFKFVWVRGHQGNKYNEEADMLAKMGLKSMEQQFL